MEYLTSFLSYIPTPFASLSSRASKNVLKQLLGHFLRDELNIEQVDLQLSAGSLKLNSLNLNPDALNHELLNAIVSSSTNADIRSTPVPFRIENCSVDDFSVSFSSLARILEDGCSVDVSGIVLDLIPGSTLTHQLLEIAKDRAIKLAAKRLEQKAKDAEEASRAASNPKHNLIIIQNVP